MLLVIIYFEANIQTCILKLRKCKEIFQFMEGLALNCV